MTENAMDGSGSASGSSSSLVRLETNDQTLRWSQTASQRRLHHRWFAVRERIIAALFDGLPSLEKRAARMEGCCSHPSLTAKKNGQCGVVLYCCRDRLCPRCAAGRSIENVRRISSCIGAMNAPRQIELTIRHRAAPLVDEIDRLWSAWKKLRRSKLWKKVCKGGVGVLEVTINNKSRTWHPHLHIVFDGEYLPQQQLSAAWKEASGDSDVVWIQAVHDREKAGRYVSKYLAKSADFASMSAVEIRELATGLHGRRMVFTFGKSHAVNVDPAPEPHCSKDDEPVISLHRLSAAALAGFAGAERAVGLLAASNRTWSEALGLLAFDWQTKPKEMSQADHAFVIQTCREIIAAEEKTEEDQTPSRRDGPSDVERHQLSMREILDAGYI